VLTVFRSDMDQRTRSVVADSAAIISAAGASMAVEFSPLGPVSSIRLGLEVVEIARRRDPRVGLLVDSWHFSVGDSTWEELATLALDDIAYVQFCDALAPESDSLARETMHRRAAPGRGVLDLDRFAATLRDRGWTGTVSVEVLSAELRNGTPGEAARLLYGATAPYWN